LETQSPGFELGKSIQS